MFSIVSAHHKRLLRMLTVSAILLWPVHATIAGGTEEGTLDATPPVVDLAHGLSTTIALTLRAPATADSRLVLHVPQSEYYSGGEIAIDLRKDSTNASTQLTFQGDDDSVHEGPTTLSVLVLEPARYSGTEVLLVVEDDDPAPSEIVLGAEIRSNEGVNVETLEDLDNLLSLHISAWINGDTTLDELTEIVLIKKIVSNGNEIGLEFNEEQHGVPDTINIPARASRSGWRMTADIPLVSMLEHGATSVLIEGRALGNRLVVDGVRVKDAPPVEIEDAVVGAMREWEARRESVVGTIGELSAYVEILEKLVEIAREKRLSETLSTQFETMLSQGSEALTKVRNADAWECLSKAGATYRACDNCPRMVVVPSGKYAMGSPGDEEGRSANERLQENVSVPKSGTVLAVGMYEVTVGEYREYWDERLDESGNAEGSDVGVCWRYVVREAGMQETPSGEYRGCASDEHTWFEGPGTDWKNPGIETTKTQPAVCISWLDAKGYTKWLNDTVASDGSGTEGGGPYRLLNEYEWEYVARAGSDGAFSSGDTITTSAAHFNCGRQSSAADSAREDLVPNPKPVGTFHANEFGLFDVHGNVWEWVEDCWSDVASASYANGRCEEKMRVVRGGSWADEDVRYLRFAMRGRSREDLRTSFTGFRVAEDLEEELAYAHYLIDRQSCSEDK